MRLLLKKIFDSLRQSWGKLLAINSTPDKIALGFAIGAFVGIFPTFGIGAVFTVPLCYVTRANYVAAFLGSLIIMNPLTTPMFWALSAGLGALIFPSDVRVVIESWKNNSVLDNIKTVSLVYVTGNLIISTVVAAASFFVVRWIVARKLKTRGK